MTREEAIQFLTDTGISPEHIMELVEALGQEPCTDAISRKVVIELVEGWWIGHTKEDDLVSEIRALPPVAPAEKLNKWIPVSEGLPEIHNYMQEYIVTIKGNFIRTAFFTETNGKSWWSIDDVIAWMPLPEPYKAGEEV